MHAPRIYLICSTSHTCSCAVAVSDSSRHGSGIETRQPRLIAHKRIRLFRIAVRSQATPLEEFSDPPGHDSS